MGVLGLFGVCILEKMKFSLRWVLCEFINLLYNEDQGRGDLVKIL
ncbi:hypothetical protein HanIR_Chr09g0408461 [Helianthus annuus]|nr:hypothetical protein HanIR_Chr09g0408461 [Helianthus annuus]